MDQSQDTTASAQTSSRRWNLWPWVPVIVIGAAVIPNTMKIMNAQRYPAHAVEDRPWEASRGFDDERDARVAFAEAGLVLSARVGADQQGLRLQLTHGDNPPPADQLYDLRLHCYRPNDPGADRLIAWDTPAERLDLSDLRQGLWVLTLTGYLDDTPIRHSLRAHAGVVGGH